MISISKQASKKSSRKAVYKRKIQARFTTGVMMRSSSSFQAGDTSHSPLNAHTLTYTLTHKAPRRDTNRNATSVTAATPKAGRWLAARAGRWRRARLHITTAATSSSDSGARGKRKKVSVPKNCFPLFFFALRLCYVSLFCAIGL